MAIVIVFSIGQMKIVEQNSLEAIAISASFSVLPIIPVWDTYFQMMTSNWQTFTNLYFYWKSKQSRPNIFVGFNNYCFFSVHWSTAPVPVSILFFETFFFPRQSRVVPGFLGRSRASCGDILYHATLRHPEIIGNLK